MLFKTKLFRNVNTIFFTLKKKILIVQNSFSLALFSLFLGFLCGNLFGTFLDTLRIYFLWNGFVAFIILLFIEAINFFVYRIPLTEKINTNVSISNVQNFSYLLSRSVKSFFNLHFLYALLNPIKIIRQLANFIPYKSKGVPLEFLRSSFGILYPVKDKEYAKQSTQRTYEVKNLRNNEKVNALQDHEQGDFFFDKNKKILFNIYIERSLNAFKIGLLFGFFIDSFKVGS